MKRLTHSNEAERHEGRKRAGFCAALAVAGLMGVSACATTHANIQPGRPQTSEVSLPIGESTPYRVGNTDVMLYRLPQKIRTLETEGARYWIEDGDTGYRSMYIVDLGNYMAGFGIQNNIQFTGAVLIENGNWHMTGIISDYQQILSRFPFSDASQYPSQMTIVPDTGGSGACDISIEPFRALVKQITGRDVTRLKPVHHYNSPSAHLIHFIPVDAEGNRIGEYQGGQLAVSTGFRAGRPQFGCTSGMMMLIEPGAPDPRNQHQ